MVTQTIIDKLILFLFPNLIIIKTVLIGKVTGTYIPTLKFNRASISACN